MRQVPSNPGDTIFNREFECLVLADDVDSMGRSLRGLNEEYRTIKGSTERIGLQVSHEKSEYTVMTRSERRAPVLEVDMGGDKFKATSRFKFLVLISTARKT